MTIEVTSGQLKEALRECVAARVPTFTWGSPGIGKSDIHRQLAEELDRPIIDLRASQLDAVDTRGIPHLTERGGVKMTEWAVPGIFPTDHDSRELIFLDELNAAPPAVQAALYQLILDRQLGDYRLPDNVVMLAAGNRETDRAVTHRMSTALADRFVHFDLGVNHREWEAWALASEVAVEVIAYLRWRPEHLLQWEPKSDEKAQATPRGWEYVSKILRVSAGRVLDQVVEAALVVGKIGEAVGMEFCGFLKIFRDLPDPSSIFLDPHGAPLFDDPAVNYALANALAAQATRDNVDGLLVYADRVRSHPHAGPEFAVLMAKMAVKIHPEVQQTRGFIRWASDNAEAMA